VRPVTVTFDYIDWELLREQKTSLMRVIEDTTYRRRRLHLEGILHLITSIQKDAADELGEAIVFNCEEY
jgi:hypothetical protein